MSYRVGIPMFQRSDMVLIRLQGFGGWLNGAQFPTESMDPQLAPHLTVMEYRNTLIKNNETIRKAGKANRGICAFLCMCITAMIIGAVILLFIHQPARSVCVAPRGECAPNVMDSNRGDCCTWFCCEGSNTTASSNCHRWPSYDLDTCTAWKRGTREPLGRVRTEGEFGQVEAKNAWALTMVYVLSVCIALCGFCGWAYMCRARSKLQSEIQSNCSDWSNKGLNCHFVARNGRYRFQGLQVILPGAAPATRQPAQKFSGPLSNSLHTVQVTVPFGATEGTILHVPSHTGTLLQVAVPAGVPAGGAFSIQYSVDQAV